VGARRSRSDLGSRRGVAAETAHEIVRLVLLAFRGCTEPDEWMWAWDGPDDETDQLYRLWPHRAEASDDWPVSLYLTRDDRVFASQEVDWGVYVYFEYSAREAPFVRVFGAPLLKELARDWPSGWLHVVERAG
jgi:Protein of unknown function (DUF2716)